MPSNDENDPFEWILRGVTRPDIQVQHSKNRVGNRDGFLLLDIYEINENRLKNLEGGLSEVKDLVKTLEGGNKALGAMFEDKSKTLDDVQKQVKELGPNNRESANLASFYA